MRTTLSLDDDVLAAAKGLAATQHQTLGKVISALARQGLQLQPTRESRLVRNGVPLLAASADSQPVTAELVNQLSDE
jgi:nucleoside diphosphate kinase